MGEKADLVDAGAQASQSLVSSAAGTAASVATDVADTGRNKLTEMAVDHGIDEARERLRKNGGSDEPGTPGTPGTPAT